MESSTQGKVYAAGGGPQDVQRLGRRPTLTALDAIAQSLAIGPIFSSAFVAFLIAGAAGGAAPLSTLIGAVGVLALGWLISLYARRGGGAGAIYDYLRRVNPALGLFAAGMYFLGALTLDAGVQSGKRASSSHKRTSRRCISGYSVRYYLVHRF